MKILRKPTKEDISPHNTVVAIIKRGDKFLIMDHTKGDMLTFPVGKVKDGESLEEALRRELKEELGITPTKHEQILDYKNEFEFKKGIKTQVHLFLYDIKSYIGTIRNMEPEKCKSLSWLSKEEVLNSKRTLGDATERYLKTIK